jgi:putative oxidoreductase
VLQENANYRWITEKGNLVILNNGIEFSITYFIMLLALFFSGGGRYFSVDYWLDKSFRNTN